MIFDVEGFDFDDGHFGYNVHMVERPIDGVKILTFIKTSRFAFCVGYRTQEENDWDFKFLPTLSLAKKFQDTQRMYNYIQAVQF